VLDLRHHAVLDETSMPHRLSMAKIHSIETLYASGHSNREIARLLGVDREPATAGDMASMAALVSEGIEAGALGFTTSRSLFHRTSEGALTPTITAAEEELASIARAMGKLGKGVIQLLDDFADTGAEGATEFAMLRRLVEASGRPLSFTLLDISIYPGRWQTLQPQFSSWRLSWVVGRRSM